MRLQNQEVVLVRKKYDIAEILKNNVVTLLIAAMCLVCLPFITLPFPNLISELVGRLTRNMFIVLALIIPIVAGMGINFAITIGAMAAHIALLWVLEWQIPGTTGILVAMLLTIPIAGLFGYLIGKLLNKMKGQEMIGSMILGYFANGIYQLLFLFIFGNLIPMHGPGLVIKGSSGIANSMDLKPTKLMYALDNLYRIRLDIAIYIIAGFLAAWLLFNYFRKPGKLNKLLIRLGAVAALCILVIILQGNGLMIVDKKTNAQVTIPVVTFLIVGFLCLFNIAIMRTRLGQQFRAVGQNRVVANAAGINVDRTRLIAITISTIFAGFGQLIFVQNMGSLQTYGAHEQVGLYAGAAILVGGASIVRATNKQALLGCFLFHLLFIFVSDAGKSIFSDGSINEYFRAFISYAVITVALVLHAWQGNRKTKEAQLRARSARAGV